MSETKHAGSVFKTTFDPEVEAGYVQFCDCTINRTDEKIAETHYSLLVDYASNRHGGHVVGVEYLQKVDDSTLLREDLDKFIGLTDVQKELVLSNV
jgi:hypothetical protein